MSCDLSDPKLTESYKDIRSNGAIDWLVAGYNDTRDKISVYKTGKDGFEEMKNFVTSKDEVLYIYIRMEKKFALITYISESSTGVKRARALVHSRAIGSLFSESNLQLTITSVAEFTQQNIRNRLRLDSSYETLNRLSVAKQTHTPAAKPERTEKAFSTVDIRVNGTSMQKNASSLSNLRASTTPAVPLKEVERESSKNSVDSSESAEENIVPSDHEDDVVQLDDYGKVVTTSTPTNLKELAEKEDAGTALKPPPKPSQAPPPKPSQLPPARPASIISEQKKSLDSNSSPDFSPVDIYGSHDSPKKEATTPQVPSRSGSSQSLNSAAVKRLPNPEIPPAIPARVESKPNNESTIKTEGVKSSTKSTDQLSQKPTVEKSPEKSKTTGSNDNISDQSQEITKKSTDKLATLKPSASFEKLSEKVVKPVEVKPLERLAGALPITKTIEKSKSNDHLSEKSPEKTTIKQTEKQVEKTVNEKSNDHLSEKSPEKTTIKPAEKQVEKTVNEKSTEKLAEKSTIKPPELPMTVEKPPVANKAPGNDKSAAKPAQKPSPEKTPLKPLEKAPVSAEPTVKREENSTIVKVADSKVVVNPTIAPYEMSLPKTPTMKPVEPKREEPKARPTQSQDGSDDIEDQLSRNVANVGYVTESTNGGILWKRRIYRLSGQFLEIYAVSSPPKLIRKIDKKIVESKEVCDDEIVIRNSFKLSLSELIDDEDEYFIYFDTREEAKQFQKLF